MTEESTSLQHEEEIKEFVYHHGDEQQGTAAKKQRLRFMILTLVVFCIIGYLIYAGIRDTMGYYLTVTELIEQSPQLSQEQVRVSGQVVEGSVNWDPGERILHFSITDDASASLSVVYQGIVPDSFKQGQKVILEGVYADEMFTASQLMTSCASKYE
jgi:cytochrome c-type biogenesis protein CcmE